MDAQFISNDCVKFVKHDLLHLPKDVVFNLLLQMDSDTLFKFIKHFNYHDVIKILDSDNDFWKQKVFNDYQIESTKVINWKGFYDGCIRMALNFHKIYYMVLMLNT